jgi:hypothetical protein
MDIYGHFFDVFCASSCHKKDSILDLFETEMGDAFSAWARDGWGQLLSYIGGALIWVRVPWLSVHAEAGLAKTNLR